MATDLKVEERERVVLTQYRVSTLEWPSVTLAYVGGV